MHALNVIFLGLTNVSRWISSWTNGRSMFGIVFLLLFILNSVAFAAIEPPLKNYLNKQGAVTGGDAGKGFSLLKVAKMDLQNVKTGERWVFDIGDMNGQPLQGKPGYFHVELKKIGQTKVQELTLDFAQMGPTRLTGEQIKTVFSKSKFFSDARLIYDPIDSGMNLHLRTNKDIKVKAYQVPGKKTTSRIVLDIFE